MVLLATGRRVVHDARGFRLAAGRIEEAVEGTTGGSARITLKRLFWPPGDVFRSYKIVLDEKVVGWIRRRRTKTFSVPPGHHTIQLEIDWCSSRELELDLAAGQEVKLVCKANWPSTWQITRGRNDYIALEVANAAAGGGGVR